MDQSNTTGTVLKSKEQYT